MVRLPDAAALEPPESAPSGMASVFTYGTLQLPRVQLATFGRLPEASADVLPGYVLGMIEIGDAEVVARSGRAHHPIVRPGQADERVSGALLLLTQAELAAADAYETDDYARTWCQLASGRGAWVYTA